jgi:outer membrane receptor for ferrienterochelin and colicins
VVESRKTSRIAILLRCIATSALLVSFSHAAEQAQGTVTVRARNGAAPVLQAEVLVASLSSKTDARGEARLTLPEGEHAILVMHPAFHPETVQATVRAGEDTVVVVQLRPAELPTEVTIVSATRSGAVVKDQPIRVETVPEEEIEEDLTIAPGNLSTLLQELAGVRVQVTSASLGAASLRLQALPGRYTQVLYDELPLFGEQLDGFSLLQAPPLDLAHVEVVKGTASALYGGSALGGVLNLVSRHPPGEPEVLVGATSLGGADAVGFVPGQLGSGWGYTLLGGVHGQERTDVNDDGWADVAGYRRVVARPRFFWNDNAGRSLFLTAGIASEEREGGTIEGGVSPAGSPFRQKLATRRADAGLVGRFLVGSDRLVLVRTSFTGTEHELVFGDVEEHDRRQFAFSEVSVSGSDRGHSWVAGTALGLDAYRARDVPGFDYTYAVPAVFLQDEYSPAQWLAISGSGRADFHNEFGTLLSTRISALVRPAQGWSVRLSAGSGHAAPVPFTEETEEVGLSNVLPLQGVRPERALSASLDAGWSGGSVEANGTLFASRMDGPLVLRASSTEPGRLEIVNAAGPTRTYGSELLLRFKQGPVQAIATYTFLDSTRTEPAGADRAETPLTPRHAAELAGIWEREGKGRFGIEVSYTGRQRLEDDPYRDQSVPYVEVSVLGEVRVGHAGIFANAMNVTDVRQTRYDPLVLPTPAFDGRWTTDVWAPLAGRVFNAGVRWEF